MFVLAYSLLATVIFVVAGPPDGPLSFVGILATYVVVGILAGVVAGLFRPLSRTKLGATVLGMIVGSVLYIGGGVSLSGTGILREPGPMVAFLLAAFVVGGLSGAKWWNETHRQ
jgi:hypothetical protein